MFEAALCEYTGAKYAVTTTSCTQAILMACAYWRHKWGWRANHDYLSMPKLSYVGVPSSILNAGFNVCFHEEDWQGEYQFRYAGIDGRELGPFPVWDSARRFTSRMYRPGMMQCVSFHATKILADSQGGAILHDNDEADAWLRRARFDGRAEGVDPKLDQVTYPSYHAYISPDVSARLLWRLSMLPKCNADLPRSDYADLSTMNAFKP